MTDTVDAIVIGAGVVGLAAARELALRGREVVVLEQHARIGEETSARSSEVIHAGIYYPTGSLKAELCLAGARRLYEYCEAKGVPHRRCGKLIVAVHAEQEAALEALREKGLANGVAELRRLSRAELHALEPEVTGAAALWSPATGIVDSHAFMLALQGDLEAHGGAVAVLSRFEEGHLERDRIRLRYSTDGATHEVAARVVVNAAGLHATRVARALHGFPERPIPETLYAKGNYFVYAGKSPFGHLVYPLPEPGGLGIHATLDLAGRLRFGPDVEWVDRLDYSVDPARGARFYAAIRGYWPALPDGSLSPGYAGIRPKTARPGEPASDFAIARAATGSDAVLVELFGIESPGLTASLAIADRVADLTN
ncbi:MAG TPA: NAD(P)/FAD-dependent oxidoreductase [Gammaproteobacteria bacterium]